MLYLRRAEPVATAAVSIDTPSKCRLGDVNPTVRSQIFRQNQYDGIFTSANQLQTLVLRYWSAFSPADCSGSGASAI